MSLERRALNWVLAHLGVSQTRPPQRSVVLHEEVTELCQSEGVPAELLHRIIDHVYSRRPGRIHLEAGGVGVTLAAYCGSRGLRMLDVTMRELERIERRDPAEIRASLERKAMRIWW